MCQSGKCVPKAASKCSDDGLSVATDDGTTSCGRYRCLAGVCAVLCNSTDECAPGNICDSSTKSCVQTVAPSDASEGGCGVATNDGGAGGFAVLAALVALARRRRSARA